MAFFSKSAFARSFMGLVSSWLQVPFSYSVVKSEGFIMMSNTSAGGSVSSSVSPCTFISFSCTLPKSKPDSTRSLPMRTISLARLVTRKSSYMFLNIGHYKKLLLYYFRYVNKHAFVV